MFTFDLLTIILGSALGAMLAMLVLAFAFGLLVVFPRPEATNPPTQPERLAKAPHGPAPGKSDRPDMRVADWVANTPLITRTITGGGGGSAVTPAVGSNGRPSNNVTRWPAGVNEAQGADTPERVCGEVRPSREPIETFRALLERKAEFVARNNAALLARDVEVAKHNALVERRPAPGSLHDRGCVCAKCMPELRARDEMAPGA